MFALATLKGTATALLLSQKVCEKAALSLVPLLVDAPMYSFQASDRDPPMCFGVSASSAVPSVAFLSSSLIALTMSDRR